MIRPSPLPVVVMVSISTLAACRRSETGAAPAASASAGTMPLAVSGATPSAAPGSCPAGKWEYDYADQFLETLSRNTPGMRVVNEKGKFICTFTGNERGSYTCATTEGGVENVFEAPTAGMGMKVTIRLNGSSSVDYEPAGPGKWKTTRADISGLRVETKASLAGREIPMPAMNPFQGMDRTGTILEYRCENDQLEVKPVVEGVTTTYLTMKRVP